MKRAFLAAVAALILGASSAPAQDIVHWGSGTVPDGQLVNVVAVSSTGANIHSGLARDATKQPYFYQSGTEVFQVFPAADSPRGVSFTFGAYPNYVPLNVWTGAGWTWQMNVPSPGTAGYSWWIQFARTEADYKAFFTAEAKALAAERRKAYRASLKALAKEKGLAEPTDDQLKDDPAKVEVLKKTTETPPPAPEPAKPAAPAAPAADAAPAPPAPKPEDR